LSYTRIQARKVTHFSRDSKAIFPPSGNEKESFKKYERIKIQYERGITKKVHLKRAIIFCPIQKIKYKIISLFSSDLIGNEITEDQRGKTRPPVERPLINFERRSRRRRRIGDKKGWG